MQIIKELVLDFYNRNYEMVTAKQNDTGRAIRVVPVDNGVAFTIPTGATARIASEDIWNNCSISGGKILVPLTAALTSSAGDRPCQIELTLGKDKITTANFILHVVKSARNDPAIEGSSDYSVLDQLISLANTAAKQATTAATNADAKAKLANTAASAATVSTSNADAKAKLADKAASEASAKATLAAKAITSADEATARANRAAEMCEVIAKGDGYKDLRDDLDKVIEVLSKAIITE